MIVRGFRARIAALASLVNDHKAPPHVSPGLVRVASPSLMAPCPRAVLAVVLRRPRYPFDDSDRLNRRGAR